MFIPHPLVYYRSEVMIIEVALFNYKLPAQECVFAELPRGRRYFSDFSSSLCYFTKTNLQESKAGVMHNVICFEYNNKPLWKIMGFSSGVRPAVWIRSPTCSISGYTWAHWRQITSLTSPCIEWASAISYRGRPPWFWRSEDLKWERGIKQSAHLKQD